MAIYVDHNTRIQILESMSALPTAEKEQCGAFIVGDVVVTTCGVGAHVHTPLDDSVTSVCSCCGRMIWMA